MHSRFKPYEYLSQDNQLVGQYVFYFDAISHVWYHAPFLYGIKYTPVEYTLVSSAVKDAIDISNKYQMPVSMIWHFNIRIDIPYKTDSDETTIYNIVDDYLKQYKLLSERNRCVGA